MKNEKEPKEMREKSINRRSNEKINNNKTMNNKTINRKNIDNKNNVSKNINKRSTYSKNVTSPNIENTEIKKKKKPRKILKTILIILLITIISGTGYLLYKTKKNGGGMQGFLSTVIGHNEDTLKNMPTIQFVIMGESLNLTDTIMVASYNPKTQQASLISIPRDTFIGKSQNRATAWDKINSVYQGKYPEKTVDAINDILGTDIKYYIAIDTKALRQLVDVMGGVEFDVPIDMKYDDTSQDLHINLKAGLQKLDGNKAEQLVRFRHNNNGTTYSSEYGDNDIGRMRTQREFIIEVLKQTLKPQNIFNIGKFLDIANNNVKTNIDLSVAKDYIPYAVNFNTENLKTEVLPGEPKKCNGVWLFIHDKKETEVLVQNLITDVAEATDSQEEGTTSSENTIKDKEIKENTTNKNNTISKDDTTTKSNTNTNIKDLKIEVLNGSGSSSKLTKLIDLLKENGYNVTKTGTTNSTTKTSIINRTAQDSNTTNEIKKLIGVGRTSSKSSNNKVDYTIIIGKDYK